MGFESMLRDLKATQLQATAGLSLYAVGFGITPLITSSFSEEFGRRPLYLCSGVIYVLMHLMIALSVRCASETSLYYLPPLQREEYRNGAHRPSDSGSGRVDGLGEHPHIL